MADPALSAALRLRLAAFRILAKRETGLRVSQPEAEGWLARFPTDLGQALDAFRVETVLAPSAKPISPIRSSPHHQSIANSVQTHHERRPIVSSPKSVSDERRVVERRPAPRGRSQVVMSALSLIGAYSFTVAAIEGQSTVRSTANLPQAAVSLALAILAIGLGSRCAFLAGAATPIAALRIKWSLLFFSALSGLVVFFSIRFAERRLGGSWLELLVQPISLSIWFGITLTVLVLLRPKVEVL